MPNINAFRPVVHEKNILKIYQNFPYFAPYWTPKENRRTDRWTLDKLQWQ